MTDAASAWTCSSDAVYKRLDDDEAVLLDLRTQRYYGLDAVGARIWELLADDGRVDAVLERLLEEFEVDEAMLRADVERFLDELSREGLVLASDLPTGRAS